jgi:hypothetical protein
MQNGSEPPVATPPGAKPPRKSHLALIAGAAAVVFLLYLMGAFGHGSTKSSQGGAAQSTSVAQAAPEAPAAAAATAVGVNPILGQWTLVDTDQAANCQSSQEFTADSSTQVRGGETSTARPIYNVKPNVVDVSYGGPNFEEWDVNGPDDLTLQLINPYGLLSCRYHRS